MANNFKQVREAARYNPYAVATAAVEKKAGLPKGSHLTKAQIVKRDEIAKKIKANESFDADLDEAVKGKVVTVYFHGDHGPKRVKFHEPRTTAETLASLHNHYGKHGMQVKHVEEAAEFPKHSIDYSKYDKPTFQRNEKKKEHKTPEWVGKNTDKPAYKRKAEAGEK